MSAPLRPSYLTLLAQWIANSTVAFGSVGSHVVEVDCERANALHGCPSSSTRRWMQLCPARLLLLARKTARCTALLVLNAYRCCPARGRRQYTFSRRMELRRWPSSA